MSAKMILLVCAVAFILDCVYCATVKRASMNSTGIQPVLNPDAAPAFVFGGEMVPGVGSEEEGQELIRDKRGRNRGSKHKKHGKKHYDHDYDRHYDNHYHDDHYHGYKHKRKW